MNLIASGWQLSAIYCYSSGAPPPSARGSTSVDRLPPAPTWRRASQPNLNSAASTLSGLVVRQPGRLVFRG